MKGRIEDFGLADVLQLIQASGKTGVLLLDNGEDEVEVAMRGGWIVGADTPLRPSGAQLAPRLVRAGLLNRGQMGNALKRRAETGEPIARILVEMEYASEETIQRYLGLQMTDLLLDLFTWKKGTYFFDECTVDDAGVVADAIAVEHLLIHGFRIADEWPLVCARIPSFGFVVEERVALPPEREPVVDDLFGEIPMDRPDEDIGTNERLIHGLCLPGTDVQTIIDRAPIGRFETCRCLSTLIGAGFVRIEPPPA
jgi:hypothetical protein